MCLCNAFACDSATLLHVSLQRFSACVSATHLHVSPSTSSNQTSDASLSVARNMMAARCERQVTHVNAFTQSTNTLSSSFATKSKQVTSKAACTLQNTRGPRVTSKLLPGGKTLEAGDAAPDLPQNSHRHQTLTKKNRFSFRNENLRNPT